MSDDETEDEGDGEGNDEAKDEDKAEVKAEGEGSKGKGRRGRKRKAKAITPGKADAKKVFPVLRPEMRSSFPFKRRNTIIVKISEIPEV
ncbi:hypothetical protein FRC10_009058 [Ceratobasidium sp. 414]|nr:hypothetical protein FRC10_009058 [Ceratobasidium sp. 414]